VLDWRGYSRKISKYYIFISLDMAVIEELFNGQFDLIRTDSVDFGVQLRDIRPTELSRL
jgi:hypothetical protein